MLKGLPANLRGAVLVAPWVLYLAVCDVVLSLLLVVKIFAPDFVYSASCRIAYSVWKWIQFIFESCNGARITISGDRLPTRESAVVVSNHVTWADFYLIQSLALRSGMLGQCRWFAKIQLRWVPFLGWGLWAMGMPMVTRNWMRDQRELQRVFGGIVRRRWPMCKCLLDVYPIHPSRRIRVPDYINCVTDMSICRADKFQRGNTIYT